jgi:hypothetical protein
MAGLFRRFYDWLLRLFWYVFLSFLFIIKLPRRLGGWWVDALYQDCGETWCLDTSVVDDMLNIARGKKGSGWVVVVMVVLGLTDLLRLLDLGPRRWILR